MKAKGRLGSSAAAEDRAHLQKFLQRLGPDDVVLLSELDGFLAGVAVCPELIMPSEWLEAV